VKITDKNLNVCAWVVSATAVVLAIVVWGQTYEWDVVGISTYLLFPLFGLLAFSLMWSHYIASALRQYFQIDKSALRRYFETTSFLVLAFILLHPGLLTWQLWRDGMGLPPGSELNYVAKGLGWVVILAMVSLLVFLAYEFRRKFNKKTWWKYVQYASDAAMLAIFYHGLRLGGQLQSGWYRYVWFFYGVTLAGSLIYMYSLRKVSKKN